MNQSGFKDRRFQQQAAAPMLRCTQRRGDVVIVPSQAGHATLNTAPSMGFAFEFSFDAIPQPLRVSSLERSFFEASFGIATRKLRSIMHS